MGYTYCQDFTFSVLAFNSISFSFKVVASHAPSDKIGIKSVQMEGEFIVSMKEMKMDWVPYIPSDKE